MTFLSNSDFDTASTHNFKLLVTCAKGLEQIVIDEIMTIYRDIVVAEIMRGKIIIKLRCSLNQLNQLKCVDNIYLMINDNMYCGRTKNDLAAFNKLLQNIDYSIVNQIYQHTRMTTFWINSGIEGKHNFSRHEIDKEVAAAIAGKSRFNVGTKEEHDLEFRIDMLNERVFYSLKLTASEFRFRGSQRYFTAGAIRPTIAHSMVWLSEPDKGDVFYDPCCGSGTILYEREFYGARKIIGSDININAIQAAKSNVNVNTVVYQGDAAKMKMQNQAVSKIVSNLPWDVQIKLDDIKDFYHKFLSEAVRVTKDSGFIILLTDKTDIILNICIERKLNYQVITTLSLHGLHPSIIKIKI